MMNYSCYLIIAFCFLFTLPLLEARTWTSRDGRTLVADGVAWNSDGVRLQKAKPPKSLFLKYSQLSEEDGVWAVENLPYDTNDDIRLRAKTMAITSQRLERDTGRRIVTISNFRYDGFRISGGNVSVGRVMEKYKKSGRRVEVNVSSIQGPGIVGLEFYAVKGQGPDKEIFHSEVSMVEFIAHGSYAFFKSPPTEKFNGWVVIARSATTGMVLRIQSSLRPLEKFVLSNIPERAEVIQDLEEYKSDALEKIKQ